MRRAAASTDADLTAWICQILDDLRVDATEMSGLDRAHGGHPRETAYGAHRAPVRLLMLRLILVLATASCTLEPGTGSPDAALPVEPWDLVKTRTMAGELPIVGFDSDRAGGLWIAYALAPGDAPRADNVRIAHVDASGTKVAEHRWTDPAPRLSGLAFSGDALWLNTTDNLEGGNHVRKIDPVTGIELDRFTVESGITDLEVDAQRGELLLSSHFNRVIALDLTTHAETWRAQLGAPLYAARNAVYLPGPRLYHHMVTVILQTTGNSVRRRARELVEALIPRVHNARGGPVGLPGVVPNVVAINGFG